MGIPHLFTFVTKRLSNGLIDIDIIQEIEKWTRENNVNPTIVIDFPAFTHAICDNRRDAFVGGRYEHCLKKTEQFLNVFKQIGVNLVFFEDGPVQVEKSDNVINRQNRKYQEIFSILDELYKGTPVDEMTNKYEINLHGSLPAGIRAIARTFGKFQKSYHNECDKEVVAYAVMVNAMAIISDDTDFLIYEGNWNYWSSRHINFSSLTTKNYNKTYLKYHLKLTEEEMPLFATLAGNDVFSKDLLDHFHRFLGNTWYKFENISRYIIKNFRNINGNEPEYIARKVFGNTKNLSEYTELVRKSLNSYNIRMLDLNVNNGNNFLNHIRNIENDCYAYLLDLARSCTISYFDVRTPEFEKYPSLSLDLIRRQLGIILHHKNDKTLIRHIYCYQNERYVYETLHPEYPPISVPNLEDLYNTDKNDELKMIKLRLLTWVLSDRLDINTIITIDRKYFCVCLTLFYMVENKFITVREADIFLHMIDTVYEHFSTIINLPQLDHIDPRAFQIIFLYDKVYQHVTHALSNCGLFELIEHNHMDGLYFHYAYNKMRGLTNNEQNNDRLSHLRLYEILSDI